MKKLSMRLVAVALGVALLLPASAKTYKYGKVGERESFIRGLLAKMTLDEKVAQCDLPAGSMNVVEANANNGQPNDRERVRRGAGGIYNIRGAATIRAYEKFATEQTRLGIPLLVGYDCIHGMETIFPIPLASASAWDATMWEKAERVAAQEASCQGINWVFSPMLDVCRDARWGRIAEGPGEDPYLGAAIAVARVKGFQGAGLGQTGTVGTCIKHYAAYGAAEGGRDYYMADLSEARLREVYLPPFEAAVKAGAASVMSSFNSISGWPGTCNTHTLRDILKGEYGFLGPVCADYDAVNELIAHGLAADGADAARVAMNGGVDLDMSSNDYARFLVQLVKDGKVSESVLDDAVLRILRLKYNLGLFDNPYKYCNEKAEQETVFSKEHRDASRDVARHSIVLLKNDGAVLPLSKTVNKITLIGSIADSQADMRGCWAVAGRHSTVTMLQGLKNAVPAAQITYVKGYDWTTPLDTAAAVAAARAADVVLMAMGEPADASGEGRSYVHIDIPAVQMDVLRRIKAMGKKVVVLLHNGRPLAMPELAKEADAIVETWFLGTEAGNAIADVVFGDFNPSGKLPVSFPQHVGQEPFYYAMTSTGRPYWTEPANRYRSKYQDVPMEAVSPFGYGLSYTTFKYSNLRLSSSSMSATGNVTVSVDVTNAGNRAGEEVAQLYLRDLVASQVRPIKELKGFEKLSLEPGETKTVNFTITPQELKFWQNGKGWTVEPGEFKVMVGGNSVDLQETTFTVTK